jgi:predicted nucleic acid-binding Zn ribbon protein
VHDERARLENASSEKEALRPTLPDVDPVARAGGDERLGWIDAATDEAPRRSTSSVVSAPGPHPTSSTCCPAAIPARSASCGERCTEYLPMKRSYESAGTAKPMCAIYALRV